MWMTIIETYVTLGESNLFIVLSGSAQCESIQVQSKKYLLAYLNNQKDAIQGTRRHEF